jgi:uncharacterized protein YegJ (DUF2314 family)
MDNNKNQEERGREYFQNVGKIGAEEAKKKYETYQKATDNKYRKRDYVQSEIKVCEKGCTEHIWIWVLKVDEISKTISGRISNDPMHNNAIVKHGDIITISFDSIESLIPHTYNASDN